ncbi:oxidoreductase [Halomonas sp. ND22Bw]|uniref:Gfo/Idh/MocA family protein n=1 Tax=unclassified Halomonas TaxID=2609666 RepID=UPI0006148E94|nr:Gfo/Idh/MocA family oxidoreductase [Halomonas sp. HG01]PSJ21639.1 oxidoreductase [Halomonas sp. ND22Bw]
MKRFALIGAGFIGTVHARHLADHPRIDFALVADADPARAVEVAERFGARSASVDEVFASDVDAVVIASSTDTHADYVERAAAAGKAIFCEKPIHLDTRCAEAAVDAVRRAGVPMMMSFTRRFDASHDALRQAVAAGELGSTELVQMTCRSQDTPPLSYLEVSGGQMRDQAIHFFDLLCWLTDDVPVEVQAMGAALSDPRIAKIGDVDTSVVTLRMGSGALAQLDCTRRTGYGYDERLEVFGAEGMAESRRQPHRHLSLFKGDRQQDDGLHAGWFERIAPTFQTALDTFVRVLHDETSDYPDHEAALRAQRIADAATRSLETRAPVRLDWR